MIKQAKKVAILVMTIGMLFGGVIAVVEARNATNDWKRIDLNASRPSSNSAPRGTTTATTRTANSNALQVRTVVVNSNNTTTIPNSWNSISACSATGFMLRNGASVTSTQTIGSTSSGTVRGEAHRRTGPNLAWQNFLATDASW